MAAYAMKGNGLDARAVALAAKGRVEKDQPTAEIAFVKVERKTETGVRSIMILHQLWVRPDGAKYWREVSLKTEADVESENKAWEQEAAAMS